MRPTLLPFHLGLFGQERKSEMSMRTDERSKGRRKYEKWWGRTGKKVSNGKKTKGKEGEADYL